MSYDLKCKPLVNSQEKKKKKEEEEERKIITRNIQKESLDFSPNGSDKFPSGLRLCGQVSSQFNPLSDFDPSLELKGRKVLFSNATPKEVLLLTPKSGQ